MYNKRTEKVVPMWTVINRKHCDGLYDGKSHPIGHLLLIFKIFYY